MKKAITKQAKPDYIDIDGDGNKKEPMKEAAKSVAKQHKTNSWEEEDKKRGRKLAAEGKMGHAEALFDDAHDSYNWKGGNDGHESWFHKFKKKNPVTQLKAPTKKFKDFDQMDTWDAKSVAKQTPFQDLLKKYPDMPASDTTISNYENMDPDILYFAGPSEEFLDTQDAFQKTYGDYEDGEELRNMSQWKDEVSAAAERGRPGAKEHVQKLNNKISAEDARLRAQAAKINTDTKAKSDSTNAANAMKEKLYQEYLKSQGSAAPQNKTMAYKKSCAYRQDGHGQSKGDQSATHTDYANYKGTDKGYHGKDGSSHGDQSATHRDYVHPIYKHMKR